MRERLGPLLGPGSDDLAVGTFHAFCAKVLRQEGEEINLNRNFVIYDDSDQISAIKTAMAEMNVDSKQFNPRSILAAISGAKSQLIDAESFGVAKGNYREEIVHRVYERYEQMLYQNTALDFDDLLFKVNTLFEQVPKVAEQYQDKYVHFMVDEFIALGGLNDAVDGQHAPEHGRLKDDQILLAGIRLVQNARDFKSLHVAPVGPFGIERLVEPGQRTRPLRCSFTSRVSGSKARSRTGTAA